MPRTLAKRWLTDLRAVPEMLSIDNDAQLHIVLAFEIDTDYITFRNF